MRRVILESPYAGNIKRNREYARKALRHSLTCGEAPIASHLLYPQPGVLNEMIREERELGIAAGLAWLKYAEAMVAYTDYGISPGMHAAMSRAALEGLLIETRTIGFLPLYSPMIDVADYLDPNDKPLYTELQVLRSGAGYYIGTLYNNPEGFTEPGSRDSIDYFPTREAAEAELRHWHLHGMRNFRLQP